jgi:hypothetical protein
MSEKYCPDCGNSHDCTMGAGADYMTAEVKIAKINADRDVEIARLQAKAATVISENEAEHSADFAEGKAEGLEEAITGGEPDPEGGEPIVVTVPAAEEEPEPDDVVEEPPVITTPVPSVARKGGYWDAYK